MKNLTPSTTFSWILIFFFFSLFFFSFFFVGTTGMILVTPNGTTEICCIGRDESNLEAEEEFVFSGMSIDRLRTGCTVHDALTVPTPTTHDREDDLTEAALRRRVGITDPTPWIDQHAPPLPVPSGPTNKQYRPLHVSIISTDHVVPSSTTKEAEKQRERDLARTAEELDEFYIPMGKAPHFVTDEQLEELGGKPDVVEPMFSIRLTALRHREKTTTGTGNGSNAAEEEEDDDDEGLTMDILDEFKLEPFEHGTCLSYVRLFDESQESIDAATSSKRDRDGASSSSSTTPPRATIRGRNFVAVGTTRMPFRGEEERSGGRVLLFRVEVGKLELVSILLLPDPVTGISHLLLPKREIERCRETRYGGKAGVAIIKHAATYDVSGLFEFFEVLFFFFGVLDVDLC